MTIIPSVEYLRKVLRFEPETGKLYWLDREVDMFSEDAAGGSRPAAITWNGRFAGKEAMATSNGQGYRVGTLCGRKFLAHRVVWALAHGEWPDGEIDHISGDRSDNRLSNLRVVVGSENHMNRERPKNNTSGYLGVHFDRRKKNRPWYAKLAINRRVISLGYYATKEEAYAARKAGEMKYGFHPNHGRSAMISAAQGDGA